MSINLNVPNAPPPDKCAAILQEELPNFSLRVGCCKRAGHDGQHIAGVPVKWKDRVHVIQGTESGIAFFWVP